MLWSLFVLDLLYVINIWWVLQSSRFPKSIQALSRQRLFLLLWEQILCDISLVPDDSLKAFPGSDVSVLSCRSVGLERFQLPSASQYWPSQRLGHWRCCSVPKRSWGKAISENRWASQLKKRIYETNYICKRVNMGMMLVWISRFLWSLPSWGFLNFKVSPVICGRELRLVANSRSIAPTCLPTSPLPPPSNDPRCFAVGRMWEILLGPVWFGSKTWQLFQSLVNSVQETRVPKYRKWMVDEVKVDAQKLSIGSLWKHGVFTVFPCRVDRKSITSPSSWLSLSGDLRWNNISRQQKSEMMGNYWIQWA